VGIRKAEVHTAASPLCPRDLWVPGQGPVICRPRLSGVCAGRLLGWCLRRFRGALAGGGRSSRTQGPAFGACPGIAAVPAQVVAGAAAIGHQLVGGQADAAHPAGFGVGLFCPVADRTQLVSYGLLAWEIRGTRRGPGAGSGDADRRGGRFERRVLSPGSPVSRRFVSLVADLGCARVKSPVGLHVQAPRQLAGTLLCAVPSRLPSPHGDGLTDLYVSTSYRPEPTLRPDKLPVTVQPIYPSFRRVVWTTLVFLICTGCEWYSPRWQR
jgi:hypothetical protein